MTVKICDRLFAELVKKRANYQCERCMSFKVPQCSHIIPRTVFSLRFDTQNGVCLCKRCHLYWWHKNPMAAMEWIKTIRDIDYLESRRHSQSKNDYKLIEIMLRQELK